MDISVSIIGAGNVATHLGSALKRAKVKLLHVWSYHPANAQVLAENIGAVAVSTINEIANDQSNLIIISVKDDAISQLAPQLVNYKGLVVHTSGAVSLNELAMVSNYGVLYPLQTFSKHKDVDFNTVPLCLEANNEMNLIKLQQLARLLSNYIYEVTTEQRKILHLAAVFACNFPNYLYGIAQQLLAQHQLSFDLIKPLITETANKVQTALPTEVQTGPAVRNDEQTLSKHQALLKENPIWANIYQLLSEQIKKSK